MNIITLAMEMMAAVETLRQKVRRFFYQVVLMGYPCVQCQGPLTMIAEGRCRCDGCGAEFDPTITFQTCATCGGNVKLNIRRYQCRQCGGDIHSRFLCDALVFDTEYFRAKMIESRQRQAQQRQRVREMLAASRSKPLEPQATDLSAVPGLVEALNALTGSVDEALVTQLKQRFDLTRYEAHLRRLLTDEPINLRQIPALTANQRLDLIWRFIAAVFLAHSGEIQIQQRDQEIWVMIDETDRKR